MFTVRKLALSVMVNMQLLFFLSTVSLPVPLADFPSSNVIIFISVTKAVLLEGSSFNEDFCC